MQRLNSAPTPEPIWIDIIYDTTLQRITGRARERTGCTRGCPFFFILNCVLTEYPEIRRRFPPGVLGFTVDGMAPAIDHPLTDGSIVRFGVYDVQPRFYS